MIRNLKYLKFNPRKKIMDDDTYFHLTIQKGYKFEIKLPQNIHVCRELSLCLPSLPLHQFRSEIGIQIDR